MTSSPNQDPIAARPPRSLRFLVPCVLVCIGAIGIGLGFDISQLRIWLESLGIGAPIIFVALSILLMSTLVPKTAVSVTAGAIFGTIVGTGLMVVIAVGAAALNYSIGRWWLHDSLRRSWMADRDAASSRRDWARAIAGIAGDAGFTLHLLIRLSPVPTMLISYSMGALNCRVRPYLLAAAVAIIPQSAWVHAGSAATKLQSPDASLLRFFSVALSVFVAILVSVIVPREAFKRLQSMKP